MACHAVDGDRIQGRDLAAASPQFAALDPDVVIGSTPLPGVPRLLHSAELMHLAHQYEVALTAPVSGSLLRALQLNFADALKNYCSCLRAALAVDDVAIEIEDFSRFGVLHGALEFPKTGLSAAGLWRGRVAYGENHSSPVWVKARITTQQTWVEAARPLEAGKALDASSLIIRTGPRFPFGPAPVASIDQATGRMPTHSIKSGEPIFASMLIAPREVERGRQGRRRGPKRRRQAVV